MKKFKLKYIITLIAVLIIGGGIGLAFYFIKNPNFKLEKEIDEYITSINELNKSFNKDNLSKEDTFLLNKNSICYKYIGNDKSNLIKKLKELYIKPFGGNFIIDENELYVCMRDTCQNINEIKNYEIIYDEENANNLRIDVTDEYDTNITMDLQKKDDEWQFVYPVVICK